MSFTPFTYNNRINTNNIPKYPRQSDVTPNTYPIQYQSIQPPKSYQHWNRNQQSSLKINSSKNYNPMETGYGRVMTQGNIPTIHSKPITPIQSNISNYNQGNQINPSYIQSNPMNKLNGNELFKSSIYGGSQNGQNYTNQTPNERFNLNNSGGGKINTNNMTPQRKLPRVSQPLLPSNSDIQFINTQHYKNSLSSDNSNQDTNLTSPQRDTNFAKNKYVNLEHGAKQQKSQPLNGDNIAKKGIVNHNIQKMVKSNDANKKKITAQDFIQLKELGSGKYGRVYLVKQKSSGFICALKMIEKKLLLEQQITDQFIRELKIQMYLNHPNIIKMYGFFDDKDNIFIILEVGTGGQLFHMLKKSQSLAQVKVAGIMRQICQAVSQIHSQRIIHRDIKPQNIVLHDGVIKLCDFGWSVHQNKNLRTTFCGTPLYVCPQILKGKQYDQKIDIWSLGIMMYEMLVGQNPFRITKEEQLIKIIKDQIVIPSYTNISKEAKDFLDKCLRKNPNQRCSIRQLCQHDFFKKYPQKQSEKKMKFE